MYCLYMNLYVRTFTTVFIMTLLFFALYLEDKSPDGKGHMINQSITSQSESSLLSTLIPGTLT